jgi:hypothetical protein
MWACRFRFCNIAIVWEKFVASAAALSSALLWAFAAAFALAATLESATAFAP